MRAEGDDDHHDVSRRLSFRSRVAACSVERDGRIIREVGSRAIPDRSEGSGHPGDVIDFRDEQGTLARKHES